VINPNLGDLQHNDVVLSDEAGTCSEVIHAVVDSAAEMCVARQDVIGALDCLTVGKVTLRGIIGEPFDAEVKRVYIGDASKKQGMLPIACVCHEMMHDQLLLTRGVVDCLVGGDSKWTDQDSDLDSGECDNDHGVDIIRNDENVDNAIQGHPNDEMNRVDGCTTDMFDTVCNSTVSVLTSRNQYRDQVATGHFGLNTTVEPDTLKFVDILHNQKENLVARGAGSRHLSEEQKTGRELKPLVEIG